MRTNTHTFLADRYEEAESVVKRADRVLDNPVVGSQGRPHRLARRWCHPTCDGPDDLGGADFVRRIAVGRKSCVGFDLSPILNGLTDFAVRHWADDQGVKVSEHNIKVF